MDKSRLVELIDIIAPMAPPAAPPPYGWIAFGVACVLIVAFSVVYLVWHRTRDRRAALAQLKRTARALGQHRIDPRTAAFQTGLALRRAYRTAPQGDATDDWSHFSGALDHARYAPQLPSTQDSVQLLARARHCILRARC